MDKRQHQTGLESEQRCQARLPTARRVWAWSREGDPKQSPLVLLIRDKLQFKEAEGGSFKSL